MPPTLFSSFVFKLVWILAYWCKNAKTKYIFPITKYSKPFRNVR